jgi:hypothetical protein
MDTMALVKEASAYPWFRSIGSFLGRLMVSLTLMLMLLVPTLPGAFNGYHGDGEFWSLVHYFYRSPFNLLTLGIAAALLTLWTLTGLIPALTDWKGRPVMTTLATFGPPAVVVSFLSLFVIAFIRR